MPNHRQSKTIKIRTKQIQQSSADLESNTSLSPELKDRIRLINALVVQIFLDPKDIEHHTLLPWIKHLVKQFGLTGYLCEFEVLIEAYTIAIKKTKEGHVINNLPAWFKGTALNIVRNIKREIRRQDSIKSNFQYDREEVENASYRSIDDNSMDDNVQSLIKAFSMLCEADRDILILRIVKGLTWSDIAEKMIQEGKENSTSMEKLLVRLRQRHSRALSKLRKRHEEAIQNHSDPAPPNSNL
jgi:DNA-directed RNA polymerase specialized sigma24 family protein